MASARKKGRRDSGSKAKDAKPARAQVEPRSFRQTAWEWTKSLAMGFVLFLILRTFVIQTFTITSGSMEGTLLVGDFLVLSKSAYGAMIPGTDVTLPGYSEPHRGDVVVFRGHHEPIDLVKRLIGLPGDTLSMRDATLFINGIAQVEPYVKHIDPASDGYMDWMAWQSDFLAPGVDRGSYRPTRDNWGPIVVPPERYFMMGDNRDESLDSRYWGFVEPSWIKGRAVFLYFSYDRDVLRGVPFVSHVRWSRIGERIR
ncbi:MAG: signal peptidase I [Gemmatimonadota bacterium]|jgi:signal peptidase I